MGRDLFNTPGYRIWSFTIMLCAVILVNGCKKDEAKVEETAKKDASAAEKETQRAMAAGPAPLSPADLLKRLPKTPSELLLSPGMPSKILKKNKSIVPSRYSKRVLRASDDKGPFRMIHYKLNKKRTRVEDIVGTLHRAYQVKERLDALIEVARIRLGKGKSFKDERYEGHRWALIDYSVEIRTDKKDKSLEIAFLTRGRFDPTSPPTP
jgi:hypothetical protein